MAEFRLALTALADIEDILVWTEERFGEDARDRYEAVMAKAFRDAASARDGQGSRAIPEAGAGVYGWHLRQSRFTETGDVRRPRHIVIYRLGPDRIDIVRVLHDVMDLRRQLGDPLRDSEAT